MTDQEKKKFILDFITKLKIGVIATVESGKNQPEAAVIEFAETDNLELIFDTFSTYRKYKNIKSNPNVAFVIGWEEENTVQIEGTARELEGEDLKKSKEIFFKKLGHDPKFHDLEVTKFFKITPNWIRYSDYSVWPWQSWEINL